jgi:hypothetical protein
MPFAVARRSPTLLMTNTDQTFLQHFEDATLPSEQWHHPEHIKMAYLYLCAYPFETALPRLRHKIMALNTVHRVPDALTRGYHETITQVWLRLVEFSLDEYGPAESADDFYAQHPQLAHHRILRLFYSREHLLSPRAKAEFVEPDLTPLPRSRKQKGLVRERDKSPT